MNKALKSGIKFDVIPNQEKNVVTLIFGTGGHLSLAELSKLDALNVSVALTDAAQKIKADL